MRQTSCPFRHAPAAFLIKLPEGCECLELKEFETSWGKTDEILCYWNGVLFGQLEHGGNGKFAKLLPTLSQQRNYPWPSPAKFAATIVSILDRFPSLEVWCERDCDQHPVPSVDSIEELHRCLALAFAFCSGATDECPSFSYCPQWDRHMSNARLQRELRCNVHLLEKAVRKSLSLFAHTFQVSTNDEGMCTAYFIEVDKSSVSSPAEAIVALSALKLHWLEGWERESTDDIAISNIVKLWLLPEFEHYSIHTLDKLEVHRIVQEFFDGVVSCSPSCIEVLINGEDSNIGFKEVFPTNEIVSGFALRREWNEVSMLYETTNRLGLYNWGTGA